MRLPSTATFVVVLLAVVLAAGCSTITGSSAPRKVKPRTVPDFVAIVKMARTNFDALAKERTTSSAPDHQLDVDNEVSALASNFANALLHLGPAPAAIKSLVGTTESRMNLLSQTASAWTTCVNETGGSDNCSVERTAYTAANNQVPAIWTAWAPHL